MIRIYCIKNEFQLKKGSILYNRSQIMWLMALRIIVQWQVDYSLVQKLREGLNKPQGSKQMSLTKKKKKRKPQGSKPRGRSTCPKTSVQSRCGGARL